MNFKSKLGIGIQLALPPFPFENCYPELYKDTPIHGLNKHNLKHFWPYDVQKIEDDYFSTGNGGRLGVITARGDEVQGYSPLRDARRRALRTIRNLKVGSLMYREDVGNNVEKERALLKEWKWIA